MSYSKDARESNGNIPDSPAEDSTSCWVKLVSILFSTEGVTAISTGTTTAG